MRRITVSLLFRECSIAINFSSMSVHTKRRDLTFSRSITDATKIRDRSLRVLAWVKQVNPESNGKLKKAITYIKNRGNLLMTYLEDVRCSLSNNLSENWLFSDTPDGASANALYLTIVEMANSYHLFYMNI